LKNVAQLNTRHKHEKFANIFKKLGGRNSRRLEPVGPAPICQRFAAQAFRPFSAPRKFLKVFGEHYGAMTRVELKPEMLQTVNHQPRRVRLADSTGCSDGFVEA
jgi:hypothetical protein